MLESAQFIFTQDPNCLKKSDQHEEIIVKVQASLGLDRDDGPFYEIVTEGWSFDNMEELKEIIDRVNTILKPKKK